MNIPEASSKVVSMKDAIAAHVHDGDMVYIGGYVCRSPFAAVHELIRQGRRDLTLVRANAGDDFDMLIGAGVATRFVATFLSLAFHGLGRCYRRAMEQGIPHRLEVEEYTNLALPMMLMAGATGMPFVPVRDMAGSDLVNVRSFMGEDKLKVIPSPFDGKPTVVVPALRPDVAIIHVQQADALGNAQMWGIGGDCQHGANAAKKVIVSCERLVSRETIGKDPSRTIVPDFRVAAVVEEPFGAHPGYTPGFYDVDNQFGAQYARAALTVEGFDAFLDEWVFGVADRAEYVQHFIAKRGYKAFRGLQAPFDYGYPVSYAY